MPQSDSASKNWLLEVILMHFGYLDFQKIKTRNGICTEKCLTDVLITDIPEFFGFFSET